MAFAIFLITASAKNYQKKHVETVNPTTLFYFNFHFFTLKK